MGIFVNYNAVVFKFKENLVSREIYCDVFLAFVRMSFDDAFDGSERLVMVWECSHTELSWSTLETKKVLRRINVQLCSFNHHVEMIQ